MDDIISKHKADCITLCDKLLSGLETNIVDADLFFGGEILEAYMNANESALNKIKTIRNKIADI